MARISKEAIAQSAAVLQSGDVQAALAIRNSEYKIDGRTFDESTVRTISYILNRTPALLTDCPQEFLYPLRIGAAMMQLWDASMVRQFVTIEGELDYRFGADAIAYLMLSHGTFLRRMEDFRASGISNVELLGSKDAHVCAACRAADGSCYTLETVPELPLVDCNCKRKYGSPLIVTAKS